MASGASLVSIDTRITRSVQRWLTCTPVLMYLWRPLSLVVDGKVWFPIVPLLWLWFGMETSVWIPSTVCYSLTWWGVVVEFLGKVAVRRTRPPWTKQLVHRVPAPFQVFADIEAYSFPSGHSLRGALVVTCILYTMDVSLSIGIALVVGMVGVAASRVALGRHYVGDVIVGLILGILVAQFAT